MIGLRCAAEAPVAHKSHDEDSTSVKSSWGEQGGSTGRSGETLDGFSFVIRAAVG
jgi:hypothetical protein